MASERGPDEHGVDGRDPQGAVDRTLGRRPRRVGLHRSAPRHGGGLLLHGRQPGDRPGRHASAAVGCVVELARAAGALVRRPRRDLAGDAQRRDPVRRGRGRVGRADLAAHARAPSDGVVWAGTEPGAVWRSDRRRRALRARGGAVATTRSAPEWGAGFGGQAFHTILPHPTDPQVGDGGDLDRRRLPDRRRRRLVDRAQPGHPRRVPARGPAVPGVRPVRAQGDPAPVPPRAALPAEPRRRLPLRRPRRLAGSRSRDGLPADFGFPVVVHPHEPDTVYVFPINGGDGRYPTGRPGPGLALAPTPATRGRRSATGSPTTSTSG